MQGIYDDLEWLGFDWPTPVRVQSEHMEDYAEVAARLRTLGVLYPCELSRREVAARTVDGVFRGEASGGEDAPWRISIPRAAELTGALTYVDNGERREVDFAGLSDDILLRRDIGTSYTLAVTHDDALQSITHVVRGADLRETTPLQRVVQALMGWPEVAYVHHGLVMDAGRKLSKRDGDASLRALRAAGVSAAEVWGMVERRGSSSRLSGSADVD